MNFRSVLPTQPQDFSQLSFSSWRHPKILQISGRINIIKKASEREKDETYNRSRNTGRKFVWRTRKHFPYFDIALLSSFQCFENTESRNEAELHTPRPRTFKTTRDDVEYLKFGSIFHMCSAASTCIVVADRHQSKGWKDHKLFTNRPNNQLIGWSINQSINQINW